VRAKLSGKMVAGRCLSHFFNGLLERPHWRGGNSPFLTAWGNPGERKMALTLAPERYIHTYTNHRIREVVACWYYPDVKANEFGSATRLS
jgi:hypothetical protein